MLIKGRIVKVEEKNKKISLKKEEISTKPEKKKTLLELVEEEDKFEE